MNLQHKINGGYFGVVPVTAYSSFVTRILCFLLRISSYSDRVRRKVRILNIIEINGLNFGYNRKKLIIDNLSLSVPNGAIYGLIGRNGSGKSTLLKLILGLLKPKSGDIALWGERINKELFSKIGVVLGQSSFYDHLTVYQNLKLLDIIYKNGEERIFSCLETVGLFKQHESLSKNLSTGQRQRLSIAMALYNDPSLLILDEPLNGLDSIGIVDMRNLFMRLNERGITILMTSHIISELQKTCSHKSIINQGKIIYNGREDDYRQHDLEEIYLSFIN